MAERRVIVVGAGPAGVRAAQALVAAGVRPLVIDEGRRDGGQIYRRQPEGFTRPYETLYGTEAARARGVHETFDRLRPAIDYEPETLVWNVSEGAVWTHCNGTARAVPYSALILCSGATDRLVPVKGWNRSGCYSLGGAQIALKAQACAIGHKVAFLGTGPLLYLVAHQYAKAGADVVAVLDTAPLSARIAATPKLATQPDLLWTGAKLTFDMKRRGISLLSGVEPVEIHGTDTGGVTGISVRSGNGAIRHFECDAVGMGWHLRPETQLADLARCRFVFDESTRQWLPEADDDGRASAENVYLAGDGARILGARCAEVTGELAALTALKDLGIADDVSRRLVLQTQKARYRRFAEGLAQAFPWPHELAARVADDAIVCRCESVTAGTLRASVREGCATEANRAKSFSRVGMGRCQGRYCGNAAAEIIAAARGQVIVEVGRIRGQAPVKPIGIGTLRGDI